ncbi:MAG: maltose ABC transporter substrate-binding protein [Actinomycetota bacterium]
MRARWRWLALLLALVMVAAACGDSDDGDDAEPAAETTAETTEAPAETTEAPAETTEAPAETTEAPAEEEAATTTTTEPVVRGAGDLVIWADDTRTPALLPFAEQFGEENGITVTVQELTPFQDIDDRVLVAGPAGEGPDIFIGAHDQLGGLVESGVVAPIDLGDKAGSYSEAALGALTFDGQLYGLPYSVENIALIRNVDLVPDAPASFEELEEVALGLVESGEAEVPLAIQQNPGDPFHNYPLFTALGGYVFGRDAGGNFLPDDLGIDSEGGLTAAAAFSAWSENGLINGDLDFDGMIEAFASGAAPFAITGPWAVPNFSDVNYVVEPIPAVQGGTPQPFIGVQGFVVSAFAENPIFAQTFVVDFLATEEAALGLFEADPRPPAQLDALAAVSDDPDIVGFGEAGQNGVPMPGIPAMNSVWQAWTDAYQLVFAGEDAEQAFTDAATQIRNLIEQG